MLAEKIIWQPCCSSQLSLWVKRQTEATVTDWQIRTEGIWGNMKEVKGKRRRNQLRFPCSEVNGALIVKRLSTGGKRTKERQWWPDAVQLSNALISRLLRKLLRMCRLSPIFRWDWCTAVGLIQKLQMFISGCRDKATAKAIHLHSLNVLVEPEQFTATAIHQQQDLGIDCGSLQCLGRCHAFCSW